MRLPASGGLVALLVAVLLASCNSAPGNPSGPSPEQASRPNIVVFLVDDLGWQDTALQLTEEPTPFNLRYRTPNVERLASRGVRFTDAYASAPVCTPTRVSLMTGRSPGAHGVTWWVLRADRHKSKQHPTLDAPWWRTNGLQEGELTLAGLLDDAGYRTIHVGKAHWGAVGTSGADPTRLGFDRNIAGHGAGGPGSFLGTQNFSAAHRGADRIWDVPGLERYHGQEIYMTEALALEARREVREAVSDGEPFFLHFAPYAVHAPITANPRYLDGYPDLDAKEAAYATMVETADAALGTVLDTLDELGVADDTVVVFTSDNGGLSAHGRGGEKHTHNAPLRSGKGSAYEGGVRVPTVISWPGVTDPGTCSEPVITHDLFPTLLGAAGTEVPGWYLPVLEGEDLRPLLEGRRAPWGERALYWHQPHLWGANGPGIWPYSAIRRGNWKLIHDHAAGRLELYDLAVDPGESRDLAETEPEVLAALAGELSDWVEASGARLSLQREEGRPVAAARDLVP